MMYTNPTVYLILTQTFLSLVSDFAKGADNDTTEEPSISRNESLSFRLTSISDVLEDTYPYLKDFPIRGEEAYHLIAILLLLNEVYTTFEYERDLTFEQIKQLEATHIQSFEGAYQYKNTTNWSPIMQEQMKRILNIGELILPIETRITYRDIKQEASDTLAPSYKEFHAILQPAAINSTERDIDLQKKWKSLSESLAVDMKPIINKYFQFFDSAIPYGERIGINDPLAMFKYITMNQYTPSSDEIKKIWKTELKTPYRQLMSFMRKDLKGLYTTFSGIEKNGPMPAYIFDSILITHTPNDKSRPENLASKETLNRLNLLLNDDKTRMEQKYNLKSLTREAEKFYDYLGFPKLGKHFWEKSVFIPIPSKISPQVKINKIKRNNTTKFVIEVLGTIDYETNHLINEELYEVHRAQMIDRAKHPSLLRDSDFTAFSQALKSAVIMGATPLPTLSKLGFVKKNILEHEYVEWLKAIAVRHFTILTSVLSLNTWTYDVLDKKISVKKRLSEYWQRREEYEWVVPVTYSTETIDKNNLFDVFNGNQMFINDYNFNTFTSKLLQYQIHARFCELAGQYIPRYPLQKKLYNCDYKNSSIVAELIKTVMGFGGSKPWHEQMNIIMGTNNFTLSAKGLLGYLAPLYNEMKIVAQFKKDFGDAWRG